MYRLWGADVINMSTVPEVVLAREAGICYAAIAMSTDYDCWHEDEEPVSWELIQKTMHKNSENVKQLLLAAIREVDGVVFAFHEETFASGVHTSSMEISTVELNPEGDRARLPGG